MAFAFGLLGVAPGPVHAQGSPNPPSKAAEPVVPTERTSAQNAAAAMGRPVSNVEITDAIRRSGMSEAQIRARLQQSGYDPRLADPFFAKGADAARTPPSALGTDAFAGALRMMGIIDDADPTATQPSEIDLTPDATTSAKSRATGAALGIFGKDVFSTRGTSFEPLLAGIVDAGYRLGAGDQIQLVMTGQVENAYQLDVRRDGTIILPAVGQVAVAGLSLDGARGAIRRAASRVYSGIDEGKINVDLTVSRIRTNIVYVIGEVEKPGAQQVSALGTVFFALAKAGGPSARGSFRNIEVRRGGQVVQRLDLYDYLLRGDASNDVRTEQGDIIFVPLNKRAIALRGDFRRPAIYELRDNEGFPSALEFAGGLLPTAATDRIQIDRILPPEKRQPGKERVLMDIKLEGRVAVLDSMPLLDNDIVTAFGIGDLRRNVIAVTGEVFQPGRYEWSPGMTIADGIARAQGMLPWALSDRVKVERGVLNSGRNEIFSLDLRDSLASSFVLQEFDSVSVLDGRIAFPAGTVTVSGAVNRPGVRPYTERQTLQDRLDIAGGFKEEAAFVEVARRRVGATYSDTTSIVVTHPIGKDGSLDAAGRAMILARNDQIFVRSSPGYRNNGTVTLVGKFVHPGTYPIARDGETISEVIERSGGILPSAYPGSFRLNRDGRAVAIDYGRMSAHDRKNDLPVTAGDYLTIETRPNLVNVTGQVGRQVSIAYDPSWDLNRYIDAAGGLAKDADDGDILVSYESGLVARPRRFHTPKIEPGATIIVGKKDPTSQTDYSRVLSQAFQISASIVSLLIGYLAVKRQ